ncbi:hypothetical protein B2J88_02940 [Rhodococcus sp. SRB_17]|nr:hypothetical protein [Rhodococcus sp. SRB_17]
MSAGKAEWALANCGVVVLIDDLSSTTAAALVVAGVSVTTAQMALLIREGSGFVEIAIDYSIARRLRIPTMVGIDLDDCSTPAGALPGVGVDAAFGVTTGISAADRAHTARVIASAQSTAEDLHRPGHLLPVLVSESLANEPTSIASGALVLAYAATGVGAAVHCELVSPSRETEMACASEAVCYAESNGFVVVALSSLQTAI